MLILNRIFISICININFSLKKLFACSTSFSNILLIYVYIINIKQFSLFIIIYSIILYFIIELLSIYNPCVYCRVRTRLPMTSEFGINDEVWVRFRPVISKYPVSKVTRRLKMAVLGLLYTFYGVRFLPIFTDSTDFFVRQSMLTYDTSLEL